MPMGERGDLISFVSRLFMATLVYSLTIASSLPRAPCFTLGETNTIFLLFLW